MSTTEDLFNAAATPITDAAVIQLADRSGEHVPAKVSRDLERQVAALKDVAGRMAKALQQGPFETHSNFAMRREITHDIYMRHTELAKGSA